MSMRELRPEPPKHRKFERVRTRKLDRSVAHNRMKYFGRQKVNKHDYATYQTMTGMVVQDKIGSYFSKHWREIADKEFINM